MPGLTCAPCSLASLQLLVLNLGLDRHPAVRYLPMYQSALVVAACVAGAVYFHECADYTALQLVFFPAGVALAITGLAAGATGAGQEEAVCSV